MVLNKFLDTSLVPKELVILGYFERAFSSLPASTWEFGGGAIMAFREGFWVWSFDLELRDLYFLEKNQKKTGLNGVYFLEKSKKKFGMSGLLRLQTLRKHGVLDWGELSPISLSNLYIVCLSRLKNQGLFTQNSMV